VKVGDTEFYVEVTDQAGVETVGLDEALSFEGVRDTVSAIAGELKQAFDRARPHEATIEFGLKLSVKSGKLTGLLVEGGGEASLKVTLAWQRPAATAVSADPAGSAASGSAVGPS
jgi:hypothetical protein